MGKQRNEELRQIMESLRAGDFEKAAQGPAPPYDPAMAPMPSIAGPPMDPSMLQQPMPADASMVQPPPPDMMPPEMLPPMDQMMPPEEQASEAEAAKGMKEVAVKALDLANNAVNAVLGEAEEPIPPIAEADLAALGASASDALQGIPSDDIAKLQNSNIEQ